MKTGKNSMCQEKIICTQFRNCLYPVAGLFVPDTKIVSTRYDNRIEQLGALETAFINPKMFLLIWQT